MQCAAESGFDVSNLHELGQLLVGADSETFVSAHRCILIGIKGYDPFEHPPITVDD